MRYTLTALLPALLVTAGFAGPIAPAAGPVGSTMKTLTEVEPRTAINVTNTPGDGDSVFRITQQGSYYLTGNITGVAGKTGIEIAASHVTIDLNGFSMVGVAGSLDGIRAAGLACHDVSIRNGVITNFGQDGIDLTTDEIGAGGSIQDVHTRFNGGVGIITNSGSVLERCTAYLNIGAGFTVRYNTSVTGCVALVNGDIGFGTGNGCTLTRCIAQSNGGDGFHVGGGTTISGGVSLSNEEDGIHAGDGVVITDCVSQYNGLDGIRVGSRATVRGNNCDGNGDAGSGAGIRVTGSDCRIESNDCANADTGMSVAASGNFIIKNTCSNNTQNWAIAGNNLYGPIIDRSAAVTPAANSNSAAGTLVSVDPNANFTR